jgi:hypothetical protein
VVVDGRGVVPRSFAIHFDPRSLFTEVHGKRIWEEESRDASSVTYRFRDTIQLDGWMEREGPYAGDFLIPEPLRRRIFSRRVRSGQATKNDLLPEFRAVPIPVQEGVVRVRIGGTGYVLSGPIFDRGRSGSAEASHEVLLRFSLAQPVNEGNLPPFIIAFDEAIDEPVRAEVPEEIRAHHERCISTAPALRLGEYPHVERFFSSVPGLVDSAIVKDLGLPRACPGRYYWLWSWDAMVSAGAALKWGDVGLAARTSGFIDAHRDVDGRIPMQWTRNLEPLDTQDHGALDVLLYSLAYSTYLESRDPGQLSRLYPRMTALLETIRARSDARGYFPAIGFYPDLPERFGRGPASVVAMEAAGVYAFCRTCENIARLFEDREVSRSAANTAAMIESAFLRTFWDGERGGLVDSVDQESGRRNESYPLFTLMFLASPPGLSLVRSTLNELAAFVAGHHLTPFGLRLLPAWDKNATSEAVSGSWYPHWDTYALSILRRAGRAEEIMAWLGSVERAIGRLGYAPEFIALGGLPDDWTQHGAASNLNCATGWYTALLHGVCGLAWDPGGLTLLPLYLPLGRVSLSGMRSHGTVWNLVVEHGGPFLESFRVDGRELRGCLKIPSRYHDGGEHSLEVRYGTERLPPAFSELTNAEVLEVRAHSRGIEAVIRALGSVEVVIGGEHPGGLLVDGKVIAGGPLHDGSLFRLDLEGEHTLRIDA